MATTAAVRATATSVTAASAAGAVSWAATAGQGECLMCKFEWDRLAKTEGRGQSHACPACGETVLYDEIVEALARSKRAKTVEHGERRRAVRAAPLFCLAL